MNVYFCQNPQWTQDWHILQYVNYILLEKYFMVSIQMRKQMKVFYISFSSRNLIADIFGESGDEEEEEFTVSIRWKYFLCDCFFFVFMAVVL